MGQPIVITTTPEPAGGDTSAAFAAGVAAATAGQAEETAEAAAELAAVAAADADVARQRATTAEVEAETAQADADALGRRLARLEDIVDDLTDVVTGGDDGQGDDVDPTLPPKVTTIVEPVEAEQHDTPPAPPKKERGFGSDRWFGSSR